MRQEEEKIAESVTQFAENTVQPPITSRKRKLKKNITTPSTPTPKTLSSASISAAAKNTDVTENQKGEKEKEKVGRDDSSNASGKTKEEKETSASDQGSRKISTVRRHEESTSLLPQPPPEPEKREISWHDNNTFEQLIHDSEESGVSVRDLFAERTRSLPALLAQLHNSGALNLDTHTLFNSANLALRTDMKCNARDYDILKEPLHLTGANKRDLINGLPVRLNSESENLKYRCLISPLGAVLRHLTEAEEERYLELERQIHEEDNDVWQYLPGSSGSYAAGSSSASSTGDPDFSNYNGGLATLFANPEKFNIEWSDTEEEEEDDDGDEDEDEEDDDEGEGQEETVARDDSADEVEEPSPDDAMSVTTYQQHQQPLVSPFRATFDFLSSAVLPGLSAPLTDFARSFTHHGFGNPSTSRANASTATVTSSDSEIDAHDEHIAFERITSGEVLWELINLSDEELRATIGECQSKLENSRKEADLIDRKSLALVKKNKKLMHQALSVAQEEERHHRDDNNNNDFTNAIHI